MEQILNFLLDNPFLIISIFLKIYLVLALLLEPLRGPLKFLWKILKILGILISWIWWGVGSLISLILRVLNRVTEILFRLEEKNIK